MPIVRQKTDKLYQMIEDGLLDKDTVITACLNYMSEDDVAEMMDMNDFNDDDESEDDDD